MSKPDHAPARPVSVAAKLAQIDTPWTPKAIAAVDDHVVKAVKLEGAFVWHAHADADELFFVVEGELLMEFRDRTERVGPGELIVVPRGVEHRPVAPTGAQVLLFERDGVVNTGDAPESALTVRDVERI